MLLLVLTATLAHVPHDVVGDVALPARLTSNQPWYVVVPAFGPHLFRSDDGGSLFDSVGGEQMGDEPFAIELLDDGRLVALGRERYWWANDAGGWQSADFPGDIAGVVALLGGVALWGESGIWTGQPGSELVHEFAGSVAGVAGRDVLAAWDDAGGVWVRNDGTWFPLGPLANVTAASFDGNTPLAGSEAGEVFSWNAAENRWLACAALPGTGEPYADVLHITQDNGAIFVVTGLHPLLRSTDGCTSWDELTTGIHVEFGADGGPALAAEAFVNLSVSGDKIAIAGWYGLATSVDGGLTWVRANTVRGDTTRGVAISAEAVPRVFAGTYSAGVISSPDGGATWTGANHGVIPLNAQELYVDATEPGWVYALFDHYGFVSHDGGTRWFIPDLPAKVERFSLGPSSGEVYATAAGAYLSRDAGQSWEVVPGLEPGVAPALPRTIVTLADGTRCFTAEETGSVWCSEQSAGWSLRAEAPSPRRLGIVAWPPGSPAWTVSLADDHLLLVEPSTNTVTTTGVVALDAYSAITLADDGTLFAATTGGLTYWSSDGGQSWTAAPGRLPTPIYGLDARPGFAETGQLLLGTGDGVYVLSGATGAVPLLEPLAAIQRFDDSSTFAVRDGCPEITIDGRGSFDSISPIPPGCTFGVTGLGHTVEIVGTSDGMSVANLVIDGISVAMVGTESTDRIATLATVQVTNGWHRIEVVGNSGSGFCLDAIVVRGEGIVLEAIDRVRLDSGQRAQEATGEPDCGCDAGRPSAPEWASALLLVWNRRRATPARLAADPAQRFT